MTLANPRAKVQLAHLCRSLEAVVPRVELVVDSPVERHSRAMESRLLPHDLDDLLAVTFGRRGEGGDGRRGGVLGGFRTPCRTILAPDGSDAQKLDFSSSSSLFII